MNKIAQLFYNIDEPFAAGFFEEPEASNAKRFCRAYRRFYENCSLPEYDPNSPLYPYGPLSVPNAAVWTCYARAYVWNCNVLYEKAPEAEAIFREFDAVHSIYSGDNKSYDYPGTLDAWNHSALDYERITAEGLAGYEKRLLNMNDADLRDALLDLLEGIRCYHRKAVEYLQSVGAEQRLLDALKRVPCQPAQTAYEAIVSVNFLFCFDGCDNIGFADSWLPKYWKGEDLTKEMHAIMQNLCNANGWSISIGPEYSELTKQWIRASKGLARPMVELRTVEDMPDDIWEVAIESILSGSGQPSFYNEAAIQRRLKERFPEAPAEELYYFAGMGCTETAVSGMTMCGGIDANLNVLKVLEDFMHEELAHHSDFDSFYNRFIQRLHTAQDMMIKRIDHYYTYRAENSFSAVRTLFTRGCIENEKGFLQGGAKYTYAVPSDSGMPNAIDSLLAIKELVYNKKLYTPEQFIDALGNQDAKFMNDLNSCPSYGVGNSEADALTHDITRQYYHYFRDKKLTIGGYILPTSHQFLRHIHEGGRVGATPDGRCAGEQVADSIAAVNGKAMKGPTLMLKSAAAYAQDEVYSIPVLNLSINRRFDPTVLRALIEGYFEMNGTQVQITCQNAETLIKAKKDPDKYRDIIVRVGGYSEYFCNLDAELQDAVIQRTMF